MFLTFADIAARGKVEAECLIEEAYQNGDKIAELTTG
jgi:hypothetical protein